MTTKTATKKTTKKTATTKATKNTNGKAAAPKKEKTERRPSALDSAARVLGESKEPMTASEMIEAMAAKGYWTSPGGKTPANTLYAAILREIQLKGTDARFVKTERGKFALAGTKTASASKPAKKAATKKE
ncbi:MAG: winged helix-turn-helix domain-containing protein [Planctomycetaceae bacterium]